MVSICDLTNLKFDAVKNQSKWTWSSIILDSRIVLARDCNPGIPNPGIPDVFLNPESRDWQSPNPGILGLKKMYFSVETSIYSMIFAIN